MPEDTMIGRYLAARAKAEAVGDVGIVREVDFQLNRLGYRPDAPQAAEQRADAEARPADRAAARRSSKPE